MLHRTGLAVHAAAVNENDDVKLVEGIGCLKRLLHDHPVDFIEEVLVEWFVINLDVASSRSKEYASRCCFPAARTVVLY